MNSNRCVLPLALYPLCGLLVAKGDRFEGEDRFARFIHWLDHFLETRRGRSRAELAIGTDSYSYTSCYSDPTDASDKGGSLRSYRADADLIRFAGHTRAADIDIVTASGEVHAGAAPHGDIG
jgi:hypothetical protein